MDDISNLMPKEGPKEVIASIRSIRFIDELLEPIRQVLERHGVRLEVLDDACVLHFPAGTVRQVLYPVVMTDRYRVTLPDGYCLYEAVSLRGQSGVRFVLDEFPEWVQQKYG